MAYDPKSARANPRDRFRSLEHCNDNPGGDTGFFFVSRYARDLPHYLLRGGPPR